MLAILVAASVGLGCAPYTFDSPHRATQDPISSAGDHLIALDLRSNHGDATDTRIGDYGRRDIILAPGHDAWLKSGLRSEYRRAGFHVTDDTETAPVTVEVEVVQVFTERASGCAPMVDCVGAVAIFDVTIVEPSTGDRFQRRFAGTSSSTTMSTSPDDLESELRSALTNAYGEIVTETYDLLSSPPGT